MFELEEAFEAAKHIQHGERVRLVLRYGDEGQARVAKQHLWHGSSWLSGKVLLEQLKMLNRKEDPNFVFNRKESKAKMNKMAKGLRMEQNQG